MSNVMSLKQIKNKPSRSAFDLSQRKLFTAKVGELLPVMFKECLPGDKFNIKLNSFTRTQPVNTAAFTRIKEYYDYFFVPYRLLWRYFDQFVTDTQSSNPQFAESLTGTSNGSTFLPGVTVYDIFNYLNNTLKDGSKGNSYKNEFGYSRAALTYKLLKYLGYGFVHCDTNHPTEPGYFGYVDGGSSGNLAAVNILPLAAYQKICQDYYRNSQWEKSNPCLYNFDYISQSGSTTWRVPLSSISDIENTKTFFDLNYCNWNKDLFTGVMPSPQYGEVASLSLNNEFNANIESKDDSVGLTSYAAGVLNGVNYDATNKIITSTNGYFGTKGKDSYLKNVKITFDADQVSGFNVLALRQAEALQKWKEISLSGKQDYKDQIEKHFGVNVPEVRSNLCLWIGGSSSVINIGEVVNTNLYDYGESYSEYNDANIQGKGTGSVNGSEEFEAKEHGLIMCIYHALPLMDYADDITDMFMFKLGRYDFAIPEFDSIGMQSLPAIALSPQFGNYKGQTTDNPYQQTSDSLNSLGYVPRYIDYKTSVDVVTGEFTRTLKHWCAPMSVDYFKDYASKIIETQQLTSTFFKVNPSILDTIFVVNADGSTSTDNLLVSSFFDIKAVRNLDYNGLPY